MNKVLKILLLTLAFTVLLLVAGITFGKLIDRSQLTKDDARTRVEKVYSGEILTVSQKENGYMITFKKDSGTYKVFIHGTNGKFSDLQLIENNQHTEQTTVTEKKPSSNNASTENQKPALLSESEAKNIALKELPGVIEDIEFIQSSDGGYYLVEVEKGEEEAEFQIHAVTGKILSVKFDD